MPARAALPRGSSLLRGGEGGPCHATSGPQRLLACRLACLQALDNMSVPSLQQIALVSLDEHVRTATRGRCFLACDSCDCCVADADNPPSMAMFRRPHLVSPSTHGCVILNIMVTVLCRCAVCLTTCLCRNRCLLKMQNHCVIWSVLPHGFTALQTTPSSRCCRGTQSPPCRPADHYLGRAAAAPRGVSQGSQGQHEWVCPAHAAAECSRSCKQHNGTACSDSRQAGNHQSNSRCSTGIHWLPHSTLRQGR